MSPFHFHLHHPLDMAQFSRENEMNQLIDHMIKFSQSNPVLLTSHVICTMWCFDLPRGEVKNMKSCWKLILNWQLKFDTLMASFWELSCWAGQKAFPLSWSIISNLLLASWRRWTSRRLICSTESLMLWKWRNQDFGCAWFLSCFWLSPLELCRVFYQQIEKRNWLSKDTMLSKEVCFVSYIYICQVLL